MRNIKGGRDPIILKLPPIKVTKKVLCDVEKIILKRIKPADHWVTIDKPKGFFGNDIPTYDWAKQIPEELEPYRWASVNSKMRNVTVEFTPRKTEIIIQRIYAKDEELSALSLIGNEIQRYLKPHTLSLQERLLSKLGKKF